MKSHCISRSTMNLAVFGLLALTGACKAEFIQWRTEDGGNGHYYGLVMPPEAASSFTWTQARDAAANTIFLGNAGHLVTVTSAAESDFLRQQFASQFYDAFADPLATPINEKYAWIGLYAPTETAPFQWVTGEAVGYTNWAPGEPNFFGEPFWQYVHYWNRDFGAGPTWTWNNEKNDGHNPPFNFYGYIIEFDGPFVEAVPEPSSLTLIGIAAPGLVWYWRRRRHLSGIAYLGGSDKQS